MKCWAVVVVNSPGRCKSRLAGVLTADQRQMLADEMLQQVLGAARDATLVRGIAIVSPTPRQWAAHLSYIRDDGNGLNAAVGLALATLRRRSRHAAVILSADLPELTGADIDELITAGRSSGVAVAPDRYARGTNALYARLDIPFEPRFGQDSFAAHLVAARAAGVLPSVVVNDRLARDVDVPRELRLAAERLQRPAWTFPDLLAHA